MNKEESLKEIYEQCCTKSYNRIGLLYPKNKNGKDYIYAQYVDSKGQEQERLTKGIGYPKGATKALALLKTYEHAVLPCTPDVLAIYGATYDN